MRAQSANSTARSRLAGFDPSPYVSNSVRVEDVLEAKEAFDVFDIEQMGAINPKGTSSST
jgi:hypothetical protein